VLHASTQVATPFAVVQPRHGPQDGERSRYPHQVVLHAAVAKPGTVEAIDVRIRFVESFGPLTLGDLERRARAISEVLAFADVSRGSRSRTADGEDRNLALNSVSALARTEVRTVAYSSPLEIVVTLMLGAAGGGLAFRVIRLGERLADLRDRWVTSTAHVARSEMEASIYRTLQTQIEVEGQIGAQAAGYVEALRPLTERVARALLEIESIEEAPPAEDC
jgi:hypothetical protein